MKEFKNFINKGNVVEIGDGVIIATYFGAISKSLVNDILMPILGLLTGNVDFSSMKYIIIPQNIDSNNSQAEGSAEIAIYYGKFINSIFTFLVISFAVFILVKAYDKFKEKNSEKGRYKAINDTRPYKKEGILLSEIRDLLREKKNHP